MAWGPRELPKLLTGQRKDWQEQEAGSSGGFYGIRPLYQEMSTRENKYEVLSKEVDTTI